VVIFPQNFPWRRNFSCLYLAKYKFPTVSKQSACWGKKRRLEIQEKRRLKWSTLRRQKIPLLTAKQPAARLKFSKQYKNLTTEEWDDFLFSDGCPKYLFQLPNPRNDIV